MMIATIFAAAALPVPYPAALPDEISFEILIGGGSPSGFRIDTTERVETFDGDPHHAPFKPEVRQAPAGSYARVDRQLARYRALADEPCSPKSSDVMSFRLTWREGGTAHAAVFADSCKGIPADLIDTMRPLADIVEPSRKRDPATTEIIMPAER